MLHQDTEVPDEAKKNGGTCYGNAMIPLALDYMPGAFDVLVGRGKACRTWKGNVSFRALINSRLEEYSEATSKLEKSSIVTSVLSKVRNKSPSGGFIKMDKASGRWHEVGDFVARERVTQSFRDALFDQYRSSNHSKKKRRKEQLEQAKESQPPKAKRRKSKVATSTKETASDGAVVSDMPSLCNYSEAIQQNLQGLHAAAASLPKSQSSDLTQSAQFPTLSGGSSFQNTPEHPPSLSSFQRPESDTVSQTNLPGNGHFWNPSAESYPNTWFTTKGGNWGINNPLSSDAALDGRYSLSSTLSSSLPQTPDGQPALLFGNNSLSSPGSSFSNAAASLLPGLGGNQNITFQQQQQPQQRPQQALAMNSIFLSQNNDGNNINSTPASNYSLAFDLSLEPTPLSENISRKHLEGRRNHYL